MATQTLNDPFIRHYKTPDKRVEVYDDVVSGLALRVTASGHKSFVYRYRFAQNVKRYTIGSYPSVSLVKAREVARHLHRQISDGIDPLQEKKIKKNTPAPKTVAELADAFKKKHLPTLKESTRTDYERRIDNVIIPALGKVPVNSVSRMNVIELLEEIAEDAPIQSNRIRAILSSMYNFGINRAIADQNPVISVKPVGKESSRDRVYDKDEIKALWKAFESEQEPFCSVFKLLLICGQRSGETRQMKWEDVSDDGIWTIPANQTKAGRIQHLPLPDMALEILDNLRPLTGSTDFVFQSPILPNQPIAWLQKSAGRIRKASEVSDFRSHDLRRTVTSYMAELGVDRTVLGKVLNHKGLAGDSQITAVYDRYDYKNEKRTAINRWAEHLERIINDSEGEKKAKILSLH